MYGDKKHSGRQEYIFRQLFLLKINIHRASLTIVMPYLKCYRDLLLPGESREWVTKVQIPKTELFGKKVLPDAECG